MQHIRTVVIWVLISVVGVILAFGIIHAFNFALPITVTTKSTSGELSVVGEGKVEAAPDTAYADVGIQVNDASTVERAQQTVNDANNAIIESMKALGIEKEDIKTSNYSVYPMYDGPERKAQGYMANVTITIKIRDITKVSDVLAKATEAGANTVQGVRFTIDEPDKLREQARDKAIENAKAQAERLAKTLGLQLGRITNVVESNGNNVPGPMFETAMLKDGRGGGGGPIVEPGTQTVTSTVTLYFEKR